MVSFKLQFFAAMHNDRSINIKISHTKLMRFTGHLNIGSQFIMRWYLFMWSCRVYLTFCFILSYFALFGWRAAAFCFEATTLRADGRWCATNMVTTPTSVLVSVCACDCKLISVSVQCMADSAESLRSHCASDAGKMFRARVPQIDLNDFWGATDSANR